MLSISNIPSLIIQDNLTLTNAAIAQATQRLSTGQRINSAADDPAGLGISVSLQSQINGLNQGTANANDAVSLLSTATSSLTQITQALQSIRSLATEAASGTLSASDRASIEQQVAQQVAQVNQLASQTTYNGRNLLNGTAGVLSVQVGANAGQTVSLNLSQGISNASLGTGNVQAGSTLGTLSGLNLNTDGSVNTSGSAGAITAINVVANGQGGFSFTDQNNQALSSTAVSNLFSTTTSNGVAQLQLAAGSALTPTSELAAITSATVSSTQGTVYGTVSGLDLDSTTGQAATSTTTTAITSVTVESNGAGGLQFVNQNGGELSTGAVAGLFGSSASGALNGLSFAVTPTSTFSTSTTTTANGVVPVLGQINQSNLPSSLSALSVSTAASASQALATIDNALTTISGMQATLGASSDRFSSIATAQQASSTDLSDAQSQITDANMAQEAANLSKAQTQQQIDLALLAQANAQQGLVLQLLQGSGYSH